MHLSVRDQENEPHAIARHPSYTCLRGSPSHTIEAQSEEGNSHHWIQAHQE